MEQEIEIPDEAYTWLTEELLALLRQVRGPHLAKKRYTLMRVAIARATPGMSEDSVWKSEDPVEQERLCARSTWYGKWKHQPDIAQAQAACEQHLCDWRDAETMRIEAQAMQLRRRAIAEGSVDAVVGLRKTALSAKDRADLRTEASKMLLVLADAELARRLAQIDGAALPVRVTGSLAGGALATDFGEMTDDELRAILSGQPGQGAGGEDAGA